MTLAPVLFLVLSRLPAASAAAADVPWRSSWPDASAASRKDCRPLFVEIGASWCQACQAMDAGVLAGEDFRALAAGMILLRSNADAAEGKALQKRYLAPFMPSFLLIAPNGRELGRMVGWQRGGNFLSRLSSWLNKSKETPCPSSSSKT